MNRLTVKGLIVELQEMIQKDPSLAFRPIFITVPGADWLRDPEPEQGYLDDGVKRASLCQPYMEENRFGEKIVIL